MAPEVKYTKLFINNEWVDSASKKTFTTLNPQDGSVITRVAEGDKADIELAVAAAKKAFHRKSAWRRMDASERGRLLERLAQLVERDADYLAQLETLDNGMIIALSTGFVKYGLVRCLRYQASMADKILGSTIPSDGEVLSFTLKQPVGVCGLILPWNAPALMFMGKVATALAAGCTVVVKPAEQTPLTALYLAALTLEAGFPPGVVNVVNGYGPTAGAALTHHPDVAKISFTGSCEVGKLIQSAAGAVNLKRISLELGGKSPLVIFDDADLDKAVSLAAEGVFMNQGQACIAASRLFVQEGIYDRFVEKAAAYAKQRKVGSSFDFETQQGPQVDEEMFNKVLGYIEVGKKEGARVVAGGGRHGSKGYFVQPTVFADVTDDMTIAREEIFGPVQSILKFKTFDEVVDRANDTNFGLAAGVVTTNLDTALKFSQAVEAGNVWVNIYASFQPQNPFGGFKDSGIGRENGQEGLLAYLETKTVTINLPN